MRYCFSGHESFQCKSLWLKKEYDFFRSGGQFSGTNSVVRLGVGKTWSHPFDSGSVLGDDNILLCILGYVFEELVKQMIKVF